LELLGHVDMMLSKHQGEILNKSKVRSVSPSEQNEHEIIQTADQALKKKISNLLLHMLKMRLVM
jgi:hypothetical protein